MAHLQYLALPQTVLRNVSRNAGRAQDWVRQRFKPTAALFRRSDILRMHELITEGSDETDNLPAVTARTFHRELTRLAEMGFIKFSVREPEPTIEIDVDAIGRY